jgi:hypothetical protein
MPAFFTIKIASDLSELRQSHARKVLNIEKEIFDAEHDTMYALVSVEREGISNDPIVQAAPIIYNIILESLILGSVPISALPLGILVLASVLFTFAIVYTYYKRSKLRGD